MNYITKQHPEKADKFAIYNSTLRLWLTEPAEPSAYFGERLVKAFDSESGASAIAERWNNLEEFFHYCEEFGIYDDD